VLIALATLLWALVPSVLAAEAVWDVLRVPGAVVVVRHSYAPGTFDPPNARLDDCTTQRNLDERGRAQAVKMGEAFKQNGIEVGAVLSSPRCRCLDTARLAFGRVEAWGPLQGALADRDLRRRLVERIRARIAEHRSGLPLVLVTHGSVVTDLTGLDTQMGEFVVLRPAADGSHTVAGRLHVD
jgi:broad specificity phosphatase PhoE